jgi:hypothetical protein
VNKKRIGIVASLVTMVLCVILVIVNLARSGSQFRVGNLISYSSLFLFAAFLFYNLRKHDSQR